LTASEGGTGAGWKAAATRFVGWRPGSVNGDGRGDRSSLPREVVLFLLIPLLGLLVVGAAAVAISGKLARDIALQEASAIAQRLAQYIVAPLLPDLAAPAEKDTLDNLMGTRKDDGSLLTALVWSREGRVVYSSNEDMDKGRRELTDELQRAFDGETVAELDEDPETPLPPHDGPVLEVYTPITVEGKAYVFEAYFDGAIVQKQAELLRSRLLPLTIGSLVALQMLQIPLAISLGRRLSRQEAERRRLVQQHLVASERERREIAADLHDGPVQDLAGVSYALSAMRSRLPEDQQPRVDRLVTAVREAVASLRRLMVDIYPTDLSSSGLVPALEDLAEPLRERGLTVQVATTEVPTVPQQTAAVLYRTTKEALANVVRHAEASSVWIDLNGSGSPHEPCVQLEVADDGKGFRGADTVSENGLPVSGSGHLGLRLAHDRVRDAGGTLTLAERPGGGTVVTVLIPVPESAPPS
jgi:two-component system, NarL family, sensor kinase